MESNTGAGGVVFPRSANGAIDLNTPHSLPGQNGRGTPSRRKIRPEITIDPRHTALLIQDLQNELIKGGAMPVHPLSGRGGHRE